MLWQQTGLGNLPQLLVANQYAGGATSAAGSFLHHNQRTKRMTNRDRIEDAYAAAHIRALTLLEDLHETVENMPAPGNDEHPIDWGHVGSLNHLCDQLAELKKHFAPTDNA